MGPMRNSKYIIGTGFALALILMSAVAIIGLKYMASIHHDMEDIVKVGNVKTDLVFQLLILGRDRSLDLHHMVLLTDPFEIDEDLQHLSGLARDFIATRDKLMAMGMDAQERAALEKVLAEVRIASEVQLKMIDILHAGNRAVSNRYLLRQAIPAQRKVEKKFDAIMDLQRTLAEKAFDKASQAYHTAFVFMIGLGVSAAILIVLIGRFVMRQTHRAELQLREVNASLESKVTERTQALQAANAALHDTIAKLSDTQNELIQAGKMASLGSLVAGISHEINTPLGIGVTSASSLQENVKKLHEAFENDSMKRSSLEQFMVHAEEATDILLRNLQRAADLVRSFKMVAVDQTSGDWRTINMRAYVDEIILSLHPSLKRMDIHMENACDPEIVIHTMPGVIFQIISNLVMNSLIHAYDPDQVGHIRISARREGGQIVLNYSDDGKGIPEQHLQQVFDPFFTTRRGQGGSGLGLNIVYNLVTGTLKGAIGVESKPSMGTAFKISFPATDEKNR